MVTVASCFLQASYLFFVAGKLSISHSGMLLCVKLTHNLILDIKYEPHVCKKSPKNMADSFFLKSNIYHSVICGRCRKNKL